MSKIVVEKQIKEWESKYKLAQIQNQMLKEREESLTNSTYYSSLKELETQDKKLTKNYLQYLALEALLSNVSLIIGNKIPLYYSPGSSSAVNTLNS